VPAQSGEAYHPGATKRGEPGVENPLPNRHGLGSFKWKKKIVAARGGAIFHPSNRPMTRQQILDLYFLDARCKLIDVAAFLDRVDRAPGDADFRLAAFHKAMKHLADNQPERARTVLTTFSDPTTEPIQKAPGKGAVGAWAGQTG